MLVEELLLNTLEDLIDKDFEKFKWYLSKNNPPIPRSYLHNANRHDTTDKMVQSYGEAPAVELTVDILRKMNMNNTANKLNATYAAEVEQTAVTSTSSTSASAPPAGPSTVSAQQNSVVVAPNFYNSTPGSVNITISKNDVLTTSEVSTKLK